MTIAWTTNPGGLYRRLGLYLGGLNEVSELRGDTTNARVSAIFGQYINNDQIAIDNLYSQELSYQNSAAHNQWLQTLQSDASKTVVQQANRDTPLAALDLPTALALVRAEMVSDSQTLQRPTVTAAVTAGSSNSGDGSVAASVLDTDGGQCDCALPETVTATVTADSQSGGATAYQEPLSFVGLPSVDGLAYNWPQGSACRASLNFANAAQGTQLTNGDFSTWTTTTTPPGSWTVATGTLNSTIVRGTSPLRGTYDLKYVGTGAELTSVYQQLTVAGSGLLPNTVYALGFWAKRSSGAAAGVLRVRLANSSGTTVQDDAGNNNSKSFTVSSAFTTSYTFQYAFFATPRVLPSVVRFYVDLTTAVTNTETVETDLYCLVAATRLYPGGPFVAAFSGATAAAKGDTYSVAVANDGGTDSLVTGLDRLFSTRTLNIKLPTANSPTISDGLIQ